MRDYIVVGDRVLLDASFGAAGARLQVLARDGMLLRASEAAYGEAITGLVQAAGPAAGLTRLAGICLEDLAETEDCAHIALQWEAIAADGTLFIALDAALLLVPAGDRRISTSRDYCVPLDAARMPVPAGDQIVALTLAGAYRPQPGPAGAGLDQTIVHRCAATAIGSFLGRVACALVHPAGAAGPWQGATGSYSSAAAKVNKARTAPLITPAGPCAPPGTAAPGSITGLAVGRGISQGILNPLVLIMAVSVLLAGLLTGLITAVRRRHARRLMPVPPVVPPINDGGPPRLALLASVRVPQARLFPARQARFPPGRRGRPLRLTQQLLRIIRACRWVGWRRPYCVVPVSMELVTLQVRGFERHHCVVRDLDASGVDAGVQLLLDSQPGPGGDGADGLDDDLVGLQRPAPPVHRDVREQPVLDPAPFRCSRWQVKHGDLQAGLRRRTWPARSSTTAAGCRWTRRNRR